MREIYVDEADGSGSRRLFGDRASSVGNTAGHLPDGMLQFQSGGAPNRATSVSTIHENLFDRVYRVTYRSASLELIVDTLDSSSPCTRRILAEFSRSAIETTEGSESAEDEEDSLNTEEFIAAVSASAEQGIALFSQWLGLNLNPKLNVTSGKNSGQQETNGQRSIPSTTSRSARARWDQEEKNDERFKQLLSAQDNVLRGSATIGQSSGAETTFVYSRPPGLYSSDKSSDERRVDRMKIEPQHLAVVPKESRRGGRAYNIHQHVNEI